MIIHEGVQFIKSHDHIIMWSYKIMWQTKIITYLMPQCLWLPNLAGWVYTTKSFISWRHITLWSRGIARSCEISDLLYLYYSKAFGQWLTMRSFHQQSYTTLWIRSHLRLRDKLKRLSPLPQCLWPPNKAGLLHSMRISPPQSQKPLWSCCLARLLDKLTVLYIHYHNDYGYQTWQGASIKWRA